MMAKFYWGQDMPYFVAIIVRKVVHHVTTPGIFLSRKGAITIPFRITFAFSSFSSVNLNPWTRPEGTSIVESSRGKFQQVP